MESNIFKHAKLLEGRDPEEVKKFISFLISLLYRLQHTTSDMGVFFGGMYKGCEFFLSLIHHKFKIPTSVEITKSDSELIKIIPPYLDLSFHLFEDWKRETEEFQINKGVEAFKGYEQLFSSLYKEFQKRSRADGC